VRAASSRTSARTIPRSKPADVADQQGAREALAEQGARRRTPCARLLEKHLSKDLSAPVETPAAARSRLVAGLRNRVRPVDARARRSSKCGAGTRWTSRMP
jgi:hypothetical protein